MIKFWRTEFTEEEAVAAANAIRNKNISQGELTNKLETRLAELLNVRNVIMTTSGSMSIVLALMSLGIGTGDEVIVPNRTWIATAHAVLQVGAIPILVDTELDRPIIDIQNIQKVINRKTKAIIPVHMNGRGADMERLKEICKENGLYLIEDAAQALMSMHKGKYLGTHGDIGCFSLSMAKLISTGQGGFLATNSDNISEQAKKIRTHGLDSTFMPNSWALAGGNFRYTDIQAAIGLVQMKQGLNFYQSDEGMYYVGSLSNYDKNSKKLCIGGAQKGSEEIAKNLLFATRLQSPEKESRPSKCWNSQEFSEQFAGLGQVYDLANFFGSSYRNQLPTKGSDAYLVEMWDPSLTTQEGRESWVKRNAELINSQKFPYLAEHITLKITNQYYPEEWKIQRQKQLSELSELLNARRLGKIGDVTIWETQWANRKDN